MQLLPLALFVLAALFGYSASSQEIRVISSADNSPLSYATVTNYTHPFVCSSDKNGVAKMPAIIGDTLSVSYVGYETALFRFDGNNAGVVTLLQERKILPPITVHNCRKTKALKYKNSEASNEIKDVNGVKSFFAGVIWSKGSNLNARVAIRLTPMKPKSVLKDFSFWIEKERQSPNSSVLTPLLISFYEVSDTTNLPGELISKVPLFYFPKKSGKQTIQLDTLHLRIPNNGIYVSLQYIMNEEYEWKETVKWKDNEADSLERDTIITRYGGRIGGVRSKDFDMVFYNGIKDNWFAVGNKPIPNENVHGTIKCEATIKYCDDE